jgi:hypothetical protein
MLVPEFDAPLRKALSELKSDESNQYRFTFHGLVGAVVRIPRGTLRQIGRASALAGIAAVVAAVSVASRLPDWRILFEDGIADLVVLAAAIGLASCVGVFGWRLALYPMVKALTLWRGLACLMISSLLFHVDVALIVGASVLPPAFEVLDPSKLGDSLRFTLGDLADPKSLWLGLTTNRHLLLCWLVVGVPLLLPAALGVLGTLGSLRPAFARALLRRSIDALLRHNEPLLVTLGGQVAWVAGLVGGVADWLAG